MATRPLTIKKFDWWLNLSATSSIWDNQFSVCKNMFYNQRWQLQTRYGIKYFGNAIGTSKPVSSSFFFQRDDNLATTLLSASGTAMYKYNESTGNRSSIKTGLSEFETITGRTTWRTRRDFAVYKNTIYLTNWVNNYASYDGTTYTEYSGQPKFRYINMNTDRLFGAWEDINPNTIYYTAAAPTNWSSLTTNAVVVWWDELGRINGMTELWQIILAMKSGKVYSVDVTNQKADAIDSQTGWFSDRTIANIWNSVVYLTDRWIDTLKPRQWVAWASALESTTLDTDVRELTSKIKELNLNANCGLSIKKLQNYYITFDTTNDDIPDTTLVYSSLTKARTQYIYPSIYDYSMYINSNGEYKYLIASATEDRLYEMESWFDDLWLPIAHEIKSKDFDFWEPWSYKTYEYIDLIGKKSKWFDIDVNIEVDGVVVWWGKISWDMITETDVPSETIGTTAIWVSSLTGATDTDSWLDIFSYVARIPLFVTWSIINFQMSSEWGTRTLDSARIMVDQQEIDVFWYANIV